MASRAGFTAGALLACALALSGCGSDDTGEEAALEDEPDRPDVRVVVPDDPTGCPRVVVLRDAAQEVQFRGTSQDLTDMVARATFGDFEGGCQYFDDRVTVDMTLQLFAELGPAAQGREADFEYFVAITDPQNEILAKEVFPTTIAFAEGRNVAGVSEELTQTIPLERLATGAAYSVVLGFQLDEAQLNYNRQQ
jgi:hypothetical protein